jgi:hypothetical protein
MTKHLEPTAVGAEEAEAALGPLRRCLEATRADAIEPADGLDDLGMAILAFVLGVDIVRVELQYTLAARPAATQAQTVTLFPQNPPPAVAAGLRRRGLIKRDCVRQPIFVLGITVADNGDGAAGRRARHVQPILLTPRSSAPGAEDVNAGWDAGLDVRGIRLLPWAGHAALGTAIAGTDRRVTPRPGHSGPRRTEASDSPTAPLSYARPPHLRPELLPPPAPAHPDEDQELPARPAGATTAARRRNNRARSVQAATMRLSDILLSPSVAALLLALPRRPDLLAALMGHNNAPLPSLADRRATAHLLHETLLLVCPPEQDNLPTLQRPSTLQTNAVIFFCCVLFPLLLGRRPQRQATALTGGPAARANRFLHSSESATKMLRELLNLDTSQAMERTPREASTDAPSVATEDWCVVDQLKNLSKRIGKIREQFNAGTESKAYATLTRAVAPPAPKVSPEDAHAHLQTLHPGCTNSGPSPLLATPFEAPPSTAAPEDPVAAQGGPSGDAPAPEQLEQQSAGPGRRPLGERLNDRPAFPSAELEAVLTDAFLLSALRGMPRGTAPGPFSPTTALLQELVRLGQTEPALKGLPERCCAFARQYAQGKVPRLVHELLSESTLLGIPKNDKGVRPIAMGDTWGKWGARCAIVAFRHRIREMFPTFQLGVMVDGGIEAAVLLHRLSLDMRPEDVTLLLDMKNAFNSVSREAVLRAVRKRAPHLLDLATRTLAHRSRLWLHESCRPRTGRTEDAFIWSTEGVRQGDALSPLLFSLVMEDALDELRAELGNDAVSALIIAFLDDVSIRAPYRVVRRILAVAKRIFANYGLTLNPTKCVIFETAQARAQINTFRRTTGLAGPRYQLGPEGSDAPELHATREEGYVLLGTPLGSDAFVMGKLRETIDGLRLDAEALQLLGHNVAEPLKALALTRSCFAHKIRHLARTVPPHLMTRAGEEFDELVADTVMGILREPDDVSVDPYVDPRYIRLARRRIFRAVYNGGLSIRSTAVAARAAYTAGILKALPLVADISSRVPTWRAILPLSAEATDGAINRLIQVAPCLEPALGARHWARWRTLAERSGHAVDVALSEGAQAHGSMAPDPGSGNGRTSPSSASVLVSMTAPQLVRAALARKLPKRVQHVLTTLEEAERDRLLDEELRRQAAEELASSRSAWRTSAPLSPALVYLQLQSCSGPGNEWILDSSRRRDRAGLPRQHVAFYHSDAPLEGTDVVTALRGHLLLPLGALYRDAQSRQGLPTHERREVDRVGRPQPPRCFCRARCDESRPRHLDFFGLHLMTRVVAAEYTVRHNEYVRALCALLRKAGLHASIETHPFRVIPDREDLLAEWGDEGAGTDVARVDRSKRLDLVVEQAPVDLLRKVDPALVSHLPAGQSSARVLIDTTFTHPGPFLSSSNRAVSAEALRNPDLIGDTEVARKRNKYLAASNRHGFVLLPYHCNVYGRLHPIASRFLDAVVDLVVLKTRALGSAGAHSMVDSTTSYKRALFRGLSIHMRRATVLGWQRSVRVANPRFRASTLASLLRDTPSPAADESNLSAATGSPNLPSSAGGPAVLPVA